MMLTFLTVEQEKRAVRVRCPKCGYQAVIVDESDTPFDPVTFLNLAKIGKNQPTFGNCPRCSLQDHIEVQTVLSYVPF